MVSFGLENPGCTAPDESLSAHHQQPYIKNKQTNKQTITTLAPARSHFNPFTPKVRYLRFDSSSIHAWIQLLDDRTSVGCSGTCRKFQK